MSKNPHGGLTTNGEWGRKHRKEEDDLRGLNNRARIETCLEQFKEWWDSREGLEVECYYCQGTGKSIAGGECGFCKGGVHVLGT